MSSQYSNLNFYDRADRRRWARICHDQRRIAKKWPAYHWRMAMCQDYYRQLGPWRMQFMLVTFTFKPEWRGSVLLFEETAYKSVVLAKGPLVGSKVEMPQDEPLPLKDWDNEHWEQARFILSELFSDIIRPGDNNQRCLEVSQPMTLVWVVPYEGPQYWMEMQH